MSVLIGVLAIITLWLFWEGYKRLTDPGIAAQLPQIVLGQEREEETKSWIQRRILPSAPVLAQRFIILRPFSEPEKIAQKLQYAGQPYGMDETAFLGFQVFMMFIGLILGGIYAAIGIILGGCGWPIALILLPVAGFFSPRLWLDRRVKQRQEAINLAMPDFLDMMVISVQGGMGFDNAMRLITRHISGPLNEEIRRLIRELDVGEPRADAFQRLVKRNTSDDLRIFVDSLLQAEELGTPVSRILETEAQELRARRINRAKERAARASPNISLITIFVIVPSVLCLFIAMMVLAILVGQDLGTFAP